MEVMKAKGLIVQVIKLNDNDCLFTVLLENMEKITAMSKGIRSMKHKDFAALKDMCYSEFELKNRNGLYLISSANIINNFYNLRNSLEKVSFATYVCEVAKTVSEYVVGDNDYFRFVLNTIYFMENAEKKAKDEDVVTELRRLKAFFEMRTCVHLGFSPTFHSCTKCSGVKDMCYFSIARGGVVCKDCRYESDIPISEVERKLLAIMCEAEIKKVFSISNIDMTVVKNVEQISERYLSNKVEYCFKSLEYLKKLLDN